MAVPGVGVGLWFSSSSVATVAAIVSVVAVRLIRRSLLLLLLLFLLLLLVVVVLVWWRGEHADTALELESIEFINVVVDDGNDDDGGCSGWAVTGVATVDVTCETEAAFERDWLIEEKEENDGTAATAAAPLAPPPVAAVCVNVDVFGVALDDEES